MSTHSKVARLLTLVFGEPSGDGEIVTDVIAGYAEPGYGSDESVVVLGNWNPARYPHISGGDPLTLGENLGPRLAEALERFGAECQWLDEWTSCQGCYRAVRTSGDSYGWKPSYALYFGELLCSDCLIGCGEDALSEYINNPSQCVTWCEPSHVESLGFEQFERDDPRSYASGWFEDMDDTPEAITAQIRETMPDAEILFFLDESSQFYIRFSAYTRTPDADE